MSKKLKKMKSQVAVVTQQVEINQKKRTLHVAKGPDADCLAIEMKDGVPYLTSTKYPEILIPTSVAEIDAFSANRLAGNFAILDQKKN